MNVAGVEDFEAAIVGQDANHTWLSHENLLNILDTLAAENRSVALHLLRNASLIEGIELKHVVGNREALLRVLEPILHSPIAFNCVDALLHDSLLQLDSCLCFERGRAATLWHQVLATSPRERYLNLRCLSRQEQLEVLLDGLAKEETTLRQSMLANIWQVESYD